jgi:predicted ABC-type ATPase
MVECDAGEPRLVIVGGPNGAGKTTVSRLLMVEWRLEYLGADQVAEEQGLGSTGGDAVRAGRLFLAKVAEALAARRSVLVESTLSGLSTRRILERFRSAGYRILVVEVFVGSADLCIRRIRGRVARGGHFVPDVDVRRRFHRSVHNFWAVYRLQADAWQVIYNAEGRSILCARGVDDEAVVVDGAAFRVFAHLLQER